MSDEEQPNASGAREWWAEERNLCVEPPNGKTMFPSVHVIEYSAAVQLKAKLSLAELEVERLKDEKQRWLGVFEANKKLELQRDKYRAALEEILKIEPLTFAECSDAERLMSIARQALASNDLKHQSSEK